MNTQVNLTVEDIAEVCHETNRAYCAKLGDNSQKPWSEAPDWQAESAINGVKFHLENPTADDAASHENWMREKVEAGWIYGEEKNEELKTHHCIVPFNELPLAQQTKDKLFRSTVHALSGMLEQPSDEDIRRLDQKAIKKESERLERARTGQIAFYGELTEGMIGKFNLEKEDADGVKEITDSFIAEVKSIDGMGKVTVQLYNSTEKRQIVAKEYSIRKIDSNQAYELAKSVAI